MVNILKNIIEKVITMKGNEVMENNYADMTEQEKTEHETANNKFKELYNKAEKTLTKDQWKVVGECIDACSFVSALEQDYMFNRGVKMGLTELSFIREELGSSIILL